MAEIVSNSVLPAKREAITLVTEDNLRLVGELALPVSENQKPQFCYFIQIQLVAE